MNGYSICTSNICHNMNGYGFHAEGIYEWGCISNSSDATVTNFTLSNTSMGDWRIMHSWVSCLFISIMTTRLKVAIKPVQ